MKVRKKEISTIDYSEVFNEKLLKKINAKVTSIEELIKEIKSKELEAREIKQTKVENVKRIVKKIKEIEEIISEHNKNAESKKDKIRLNRFLEDHFKTDIRRINEYLAIQRAVDILDNENNSDPIHEVEEDENIKESTLDAEEVKLTSLIVLGQATKSKDECKSNMAEDILKKKKLPDGTSLAKASAFQVTNLLNEISTKSSKTVLRSLESLLETVNEKTSNLQGIEIDKRDKPEIKNKVENFIDKSDKILKQLKKFREKL